MDDILAVHFNESSETVLEDLLCNMHRNLFPYKAVKIFLQIPEHENPLIRDDVYG